MADAPKLADALDAQASASRAVALSLDYYDEAIRELRAAVVALNAKVPELARRVEACEQFARGDEPEPWYVTLLDRGREITVTVYGKTKAHARREAHALHPHGHIIHIEHTRDEETK